ncbi:MAG: hypothetical protein KAH32_00910 [Chlamydiia bacterium]|nr:hypothetical protein [Chlamydiia bacterium]
MFSEFVYLMPLLNIGLGFILFTAGSSITACFMLIVSSSFLYFVDKREMSGALFACATVSLANVVFCNIYGDYWHTGIVNAWLIINSVSFAVYSCMKMDSENLFRIKSFVNSFVVVSETASQGNENRDKILKTINEMREDVVSIVTLILRGKLLSTIVSENVSIRNIKMDNIDNDRELITDGDLVAIELTKKIKEKL